MPRSHAPAPAARFATVADVAATLRVPRTRAYELIHDGSLPHTRIGRQILVPAKALQQFADQLEAAAVAHGQARTDRITKLAWRAFETH